MVKSKWRPTNCPAVTESASWYEAPLDERGVNALKNWSREASYVLLGLFGCQVPIQVSAAYVYGGKGKNRDKDKNKERETRTRTKIVTAVGARIKTQRSSKATAHTAHCGATYVQTVESAMHSRDERAEPLLECERARGRID